MQTTTDLTRIQLTFLDWVARGLSMSSAATEVKVGWAQIMEWKRSNAVFHLALEEAIESRTLLNRERAQDLFYEALQVLQQVIRDHKASPSIRLRASLAAIKVSTGEPQAKRKPQPKPESVHNSAQARPIRNARHDSDSGATTAEPAAA